MERKPWEGKIYGLRFSSRGMWKKGHAWNGLMVQKTILVQIQSVALALVLRSAAATAGQVEK